MGILAFIVADLCHEALGHGLTVLIVGGRPIQLTTTYFASSGSTSRWIPASGGAANVLVGLLSLAALHVLRPRSAHWRYFMVLVAAFNLLFGAAYPAYSGLTLFGDWAGVISGLEPAWLWRILLVVFSVGGYLLSLSLVAAEMSPFCGSETPDALARIQRITLIPYVAAILASCVAGALGPRGWTGVVTAALPAPAAAFGLTQVDHFRQARVLDAGNAPAGPITRILPWILTTGAVLAFFVGVLGPGIAFKG
jgi:hypothetical protein